MAPAQDPLYRLHQFQAERLGEVALPYESFRATLVVVREDSTDLGLLFLRSGGLKPPISQAISGQSESLV